MILLLATLVAPHMSGGVTGGSLITLAAHDAEGKRHAVVLGAHRDATADFDAALGEIPVPPVPMEGMFDLRLLDPPGREREPGSGVYCDMRPFVARTQIDTFLVLFRTAGDAYPLTLAFGVDLPERCDSVAVFLHEADGLRGVRLQGLSWQIPDGTVERATVIRYGVKEPPRRIYVEP